MYNSIKRYYDMGKYTDDQMKVFVQATWINPEQYEDITGKAYTE
ncbi:XkdX family protein [Peribacillus sp. NPDC096379]